MNPEQQPHGGPGDYAGPAAQPYGQGYPGQYPQGAQQGYSYQQYGNQNSYGYGYQQYPQQPTLPMGWQPAGVEKRIWAGLIDMIIMTVLTVVIAGGVLALSIGGALAVTPPSGEANGGVVAFIILGILLFYALVLGVPLYYRWFAHTKHGRTFGKKMMGTRVIDVQTGGLPRKGGTFGRELVFLLLGWIACLWIIWDPRQQGVHDKAGKTAVVLG